MHKLLLADDSVTIQRVIELTFSGEDIQVVAVNDGEQAITRIPLERPDIVLADIAMPKRSGYDVAAFVKGRPDLAHIPVVLLAGAFEPVDQSRAEQVQCDGVLIKPFEPRQVIARVRELIESAAARAALAAESATTIERLVPRDVSRNGGAELQAPIDITPVAATSAPAAAPLAVPAPEPIPAEAPTAPVPSTPPASTLAAPAAALPEPEVLAAPVPVPSAAPAAAPIPAPVPAPVVATPVVPDLPPELQGSQPPPPRRSAVGPATSIDDYLDRLNVAFSSLGRQDAASAPPATPASAVADTATSDVMPPAAPSGDDAFPPVDSLDDYFERLNAAFASGPSTSSAPPSAPPLEPEPDRDVIFGSGDESLDLDYVSGGHLPTIAELVGDDSLSPRAGSPGGSGIADGDAGSLPRFEPIASAGANRFDDGFGHPSSLAEAFGALLGDDADEEFGETLSHHGVPVDEALVERVTRRVLDRLAPEVAIRLRQLVRDELEKVGTGR